MELPPSVTGVQMSSLGLMTFAPNTKRPRTAVANELSIRSITCVSSTCSAYAMAEYEPHSIIVLPELSLARLFET